MSKRMRFWMMGVLGVMMAGLVCINVYALDDKDVVGTWYANSLTIDGLNVFHPGAIMMEMSMEIKEGGIEFIRVTDNGAGIEKSEVRNAFMRHATSKITQVSDLLKLHSLGFRGEALSSIAAVSKVELILSLIHI